MLFLPTLVTPFFSIRTVSLTSKPFLSFTMSFITVNFESFFIHKPFQLRDQSWGNSFSKNGLWPQLIRYDAIHASNYDFVWEQNGSSDPPPPTKNKTDLIRISSNLMLSRKTEYVLKPYLHRTKAMAHWPLWCSAVFLVSRWSWRVWMRPSLCRRTLLKTLPVSVKKNTQHKMSTVILCDLNSSVRSDSTCQEQFLVPLPLYHPWITMVKTGLKSGSGTKNCSHQVLSIYETLIRI